ncbi:hypothetical protein [Luteolibacter sp. LG18]|uniref:hypothetical protein n=1 Tax=Luteolibacter sp. LG18 TaxID=2819286 RepID=UPI002B3181DD|nr:hypothetical protein llg_22900 [Luteolibacter sp. LG18]
MKPRTQFPAFGKKPGLRRRGFSLIITLLMMVLLSTIALGLLGLSGITLRTSTRGEAMQMARANARMALIMAIGDLQKTLGPDTRISTTADQIQGDSVDESKPPVAQRNWVRAYKSWATGKPGDPRVAPEFQQWLVSGDPTQLKNPDFAVSAVTGDSVEIVTANTVGSTGQPVRVPLITRKDTTAAKNNDRLGWWVSDLGTKAQVAPAAKTPSALAEVRSDQQAAPAYALKNAGTGTTKPFAAVTTTDPKLGRLPTWQSSALIADKPENTRGLYHDFATQNRGLLTNVRTGGFRKDLSMELERAPGQKPDSTSTALYQVGGETGINLQELWSYYNIYKQLKRGGSYTYTTGGTLSSNAPYLLVAEDATKCADDENFYLKQPVITSYQMALSFKTMPVTVSGATVNRLHLYADPIITLWNPLDVPVVIPAKNYITVKYWQIPYDMVISKGGTIFSCPLAASLSDATTTSDGDSNFLSMRMGVLQQIVLKPGEVVKMSQVGAAIPKSSVGSSGHQLDANKGFNYGGGVYMPVRTRAGQYVDVAATDSISYSLQPNEFTAGATSQSGHTVNSGGTSHSRHFSLTHHEVYMGEDRGTPSLGYGNMTIDWDFGDRRLKPTDQNRADFGPGTKKPAERLYANVSRLSSIFRTITGPSETRSLSFASLNSQKQPFVLFSFNAKTEKGGDRGTRSLARFNPKALHVDFYDLTDKERDLLPYEYTVEPLLSWKNTKLEVSSSGNGYFGGGMDAASGCSTVITHSIPREPLVSLAAFQHSFANGFDIVKPRYGYASLNTREPMLPQISHAIGNSAATPVLPANKSEGTLSGNRPLADHSYLANQALWDTWFCSGIAPQTVDGYSRSRTQKQVAQEFFTGTTPLPVAAYKAELRGQKADTLVSTYFSGTTPSPNATAIIASLIRVDGMFNVNSTSVEAWKSLLGALRDRPVVVADASGRESLKTESGTTLVAGLRAPQDLLINPSSDVQAADQWSGRRTLTDEQIEALARDIVREVRKRGPFLSLADFVNRRVGSNEEIARSGAIQSALDFGSNTINSPYRQSRAVSSAVSGRFAFPKAEDGPISTGAPGVVSQADILTPIAPVLSARSDSFVIRAYGDRTDADGKVIARAWCEAVVQRSPEFVDPVDAVDKDYTKISSLNQRFGRRFEIVSFRWIDSRES